LAAVLTAAAFFSTVFVATADFALAGDSACIGANVQVYQKLP